MPRADMNCEHDRTWTFDVPLPLMPAGTEGTDVSFLLIPRTCDVDLGCVMNHFIWHVLLRTCSSYELLPLWLSSLVTDSSCDLFPLAYWELSASCIHVWFICVSLQTSHNATQKHINTWLGACPCLEGLLSANFLKCRPDTTCTFQCLSFNSFSLKGPAVNSLLFLDLHMILPKRYLCRITDLTHIVKNKEHHLN